MTFFSKLEKWKEAVKEMNASFDELDSQRDECYQWMANAIKVRFKHDELPVPRIFFEPDGSRIVCTWDTIAQDDIKVPFELILDLHMDFSFDKVLEKDGFWRKRLVFYPFRED